MSFSGFNVKINLTIRLKVIVVSVSFPFIYLSTKEITYSEILSVVSILRRVLHTYLQVGVVFLIKKNMFYI